ncbi:cupin domain-containing protein [Streptomyces odontomachi]|uniref:cupin domain-containing protein n=1 Tax=Streptomyces odontomachi TaxID=2944940 RepID=UPI00210C9219|nr:cupin domain-containing protein [Streptomyces sp. ODS25]
MFQNLIRPLDAFETLVQLRVNGSATVSARPATVEVGLWTVAMHRADSDAALHSDVWERHPTGDEVLCALSGAFTVHLRDHGAPPVTLTAGRTCVVPAGHWHRLAVVEPGDLLSITPRTGTRHERVAPDVHTVEGRTVVETGQW